MTILELNLSRKWSFKFDTNYRIVSGLICFCLLIISFPLFASASLGSKTLRYKTFFGNCPSRTAGSFTLKMAKSFELNHSLYDLKKIIVDEKLQDRHFLSKYEIKYDPIINLLQFDLDCPIPLMKAQIYKGNNDEYYDAILTDQGTFVDPTYEALLRSEQKLVNELPTLALPVTEMDKKVQENISSMMMGLDRDLRKQLSEVALSTEQELTLILSVNNKPISVFLGKEEWDLKISKLERIINQLKETETKHPHVINMTNSKKIVVKFNDNL